MYIHKSHGSYLRPICLLVRGKYETDEHYDSKAYSFIGLSIVLSLAE